MRNEFSLIYSPKRLPRRFEQDRRSFVPVLHAMIITLPEVAAARLCPMPAHHMSNKGERGKLASDNPDHETRQPGEWTCYLRRRTRSSTEREELSVVRLPALSPARGQGSSLPVTASHQSRRWLRKSPKPEAWPRWRKWTPSTSRPLRSTSAKWSRRLGD